MPTTRTGYDEGMTGLAATWWTNPTMSGTANSYSTRDPNSNWATTAPGEGINGTGVFSGRLTGRLQVDTTDTYYFGTGEPDANDGMRVYVDDNLVFNRTYAASVLESKPIGYWRLGDGDTTAKDVSGNNRNGVYSGTVNRKQPGAMPDDNDASADFAGGRVEIPGDGLDLNGAMTVEMWVKPRVTDQWNGHQDLINKIDHVGTRRSSFDLVLREDYKLDLVQDNGSGNTGPGPSTSALGPNRWNHVAVTRDAGNRIVYYVNGAKAGEGTAGGAGTTAGPVKIGFRDGEVLGSAAQIDEVAVYDKALPEKDIVRHLAGARGVNQGRQAVTLSAGSHRIRIDYQQHPLTGNQIRQSTGFGLTWKPGANNWAVIPAAKYTPDYGLATSTTTPDSDNQPQELTRTVYTENGNDPAYSLATATVIDPDGLALTGRTAYEVPGDGFLRRTSRTLPSGATTTYAYYGSTETRANPCVTDSPSVVQSGLAKTTTTTAGPVDEQVYDLRGRVVASSIAGDPWTCTSFDERGRVVERKFPGHGSSAERLVRYDHAVGDDPLTSSVTDPHGTITTKIDLLGRVVVYTDIHGVRTETTYDQAGRATGERVVPPAGTAQVTTATYDDANRLLTTTLDTAQLASVTYDAAGELASVAYQNGTSLKSVGKDASGRPVSLTWRTADGHGIVSAVTRSQSGTITDETLGGVDARPGAPNYIYDAAGRLTEAWVAGHHYTYDFTSPASSTCPTGSASNAGANTNRVRLLDHASAGTTETAYCYDTADRLLATTGATAVTDVQYDNHGNTTRFTNAGSTTSLDRDGAGRNTAARTTGADPADIAYTRDATDRIVRRTASTGDQTTEALYAHTGAGDTADLVLDSAKNILTRSISLPSGVLLTVTGTGRAFDHPTVRGDLSLTTDTTGNQVGPLRTYSPHGEPLPTDGTADPDAVPDNLPGQMDLGWLGQHQRPYEHAGALSLVQMGARPYSPLLGRFLSVDPVDGGSANDYDYVTANPINANDLDGRVDWGGFFKKALTVASVAVAVGCVVASAGACLIAGAAVLGAQTIHERVTTGRVDWTNFAVNAAFTAIGGGAGRAMSSSWFAKSVVRTPQKLGRHWNARVRHTLPVNWRATARNWGNNAHVNTFQIAAIQSWDAYRAKAMKAV